MTKWQLVPTEPTGDMMDAIKTADRSYNAWKGALKIAPTPPEGKPVKPYAYRAQFVERKGISFWQDCPIEDVEKHKKRGALTQVIYSYVDQPVLYAHPAPPSELVKAAEDVLAILLRVWVDTPGVVLDMRDKRKVNALRFALDKVKA